MKRGKKKVKFRETHGTPTMALVLTEGLKHQYIDSLSWRNSISETVKQARRGF
jgi:hypothetical protein